MRNTKGFLLAVSMLVAVLQPNGNAAAAPCNKVNSTLSGKLLGTVFNPDKIVVEDGILRIGQGGTSVAEKEVTVFLKLEKGSIPSGKEFVVYAKGKPGTDPMLVLALWPDDGQRRSETILTGYQMKLTFGKEEKKGFLAGTISLVVPGKFDTQVRGDFIADIQGFRIIDGKVDLTADSIDTLLVVAESYLQEKHQGKRVLIEKAKEEALLITPQNGRLGQAYIEYSTDGVQKKKVKFQFEKYRGKWTVTRELKPTQTFLAHPLHVPVPIPAPVGGKLPQGWGDFFRYLAAKRGEVAANNKYPGKTLVNSETIVAFDIKQGVVETEFSVEVEGGGKFVKRYLFPLHQEKGAWKFKRKI
ncbi:MAG: hypothetical protein HYS23_11390 [Geobacter sp.]|nr:hypothetical protein [Geobacter sp.]